LQFDVAVQAIAGEIEEQSLLLEKSVEAGNEAQQHLVGIDDQQWPSCAESRPGREQIVVSAHIPPSS
jgi:hypothetical protein